VTDVCYPRHRHQEFLRFLKQVTKTYPRQELHIVCDNYATHKHPKVKHWLERNLSHPGFGTALSLCVMPPGWRRWS
jgi:hypothetical protein